MGVPESAIILEEKSRTTIGNAYYCLFIVKKARWKSVVLVTDELHMPRAKYLFGCVIEGITIISHSTPAASSSWKLIGRRIIEWCKLFWIIVRGIHFTKL
jgi:uncharacterized SAM-binding protein YcdF (DUF218 family)